MNDPQEVQDANKMLQNAQRHLLAIMNSSNDAIISKDRNGIITTWNPGAERILGYTAEEVVGKPISILFPPDRLVEERTIEQNVLIAGGRLRQYETVRRRKDGSLVDVSLTISPIHNERGEIIGASTFAHDIMDRKRAENEIRELNRTLEERVQERSEALVRSEKRYHDTLDKMMEGVQMIDHDWRYTYVNDAVVAQSRYTREDLIGHTMMEMYPGIETTPLFQVLQKCMDERVAQTMDNEFTFPDGSRSTYQLSIQPMATGIFILSTDITERKKAEADLRTSEERFHDALDILIEGVQIIGYDWRHLYVNDAFVAQSPFTKEELLNTSLMERYPEIARSELFKVLQQCMEERASRVMETDFTFPNGISKSFYLSIQPVREGLFLLSTDITERKLADLEMARQRERLEQQNKELEQFAYIASHDLQEPLRMVTSYVQLLQRRYSGKLDSDANDFIAFAVDGTRRMKQLIDDLLAYSRSGRAVATETVDMNTVLEQVRANLAMAINESGARIVSTVLPRLRASQTEMLQVMQNLVGNAIKFRRDDVETEILVNGRQEADHWRFDVEDNGIGIDEQYGDKVFVPFKRLNDKAKYTGSGIGLAVARKIVERYGGRIWFTSKPSQGTTFHFTIKRNTS